MKITPVGLMVEVEKITFKVGVYLNVQFQLGDDGPQIIQRVRSVKHYDKFFRTPPKKGATGEAPPQPKKLLEVHFHLLTENNKTAITKFLLFERHKAALRKSE